MNLVDFMRISATCKVLALVRPPLKENADIKHAKDGHNHHQLGRVMLKGPLKEAMHERSRQNQVYVETCLSRFLINST